MSAPASLSVTAAELTDLAAIRSFVRTAATSLDASPDAVPDLVLAVDEAVSNIIRHGYVGRRGPVGIEIARDHARIVVRVTDDAPPFDPTAWPTPNIGLPLERRPAGGFGIHLVRTCVDEVVHRAGPDAGNELILVKADGPEGGNGAHGHDR